MKQQSLQTFIQLYTRAFGLKNILIEQQYSMRSYETGLYDIRADGNLRSMINILNETDLGNIPDYCISITTPLRTQLKNGEADLGWLNWEFKEEIQSKIVLVEMEYGVNALENRQKGVAFCNQLQNELVITYFAVENREHTVFICPGSPRPENPLYSMKEAPWFGEQVDTATATFFFNANQDIYSVSSKNKLLHSKIFEISEFVKIPDFSNVTPQYDEIENVDIYFPYRLTDADYGFEKLVKEYSSSIFGVTDPNNSLEKLSYFEEIKDRVVKLDPQKHKNYLLAACANLHTRVYMPADLTKTIHMGPVEILSYFRFRPEKILFPSDWEDDKISSVINEARRAVIGLYDWRTWDSEDRK